MPADHDPRAPGSRAPRRPRTRRREWMVWSSSLLVAGTAAVIPALAEAEVNRELRDRMGVGESFTIDIDLDGLELQTLDRDLPGGRGHVHVDHLRLRPSADGLHLELEGLDAQLRRGAAQPVEREAAARDGAPAASSGSPPPSDPLTSILRRLRGIPVHVDARDSRVTVELAPGVIAEALDPELELPGDGTLTGRGTFELGLPTAPDWARAALEFSAADTLPGALAVHGRVDFVSAQLDLTGNLDRQGARLELRERAGSPPADARAGWASIVASAEALQLAAKDLPLAPFEPLAALVAQQLGKGVQDNFEPKLASARMDGEVELTRVHGRTTARFESVELRDFVLDSQLLASQPIHFTALTVDGELHREHLGLPKPGSRAPSASAKAGPSASTEAGTRTGGTLLLGHGGVQLAMRGQLDPEGARLSLEMPPTPCQALIDDLPGGTAPLLAGTQLRGEIAAEIGVELSYAELEAARARYLVDGELVLPDNEDFTSPGQLRFEFPFLESCAVERLAPGVDVQGLRGPYHHDFVTGSGKLERRTLATGDEHYAALDDISTVALAFVILEDARYWSHDGFDRDQIERAFWFNLLEGRVRRGASTITQQTARSLWLGIDRSISRKLAEALLSAELERGVDKQRILEIYLNVIELGPEVHGVVEAAQYHFGKHPSELDLLESLHLASMAPAPVGYSKRFADGVVDGEWRGHLHQQIRRLRIRHLISNETARKARAGQLRLLEHPELLETPSESSGQKTTRHL